VKPAPFDYVRAGSLEEALTALDDAVQRFEACESAIELVRALSDRARVRRETGRAGQAEEDLARANEILGRCGASHAILGSTW